MRGVLAQTPVGVPVNALASKVKCAFENATNTQKQTTAQTSTACKDDETNEQAEPNETPDAAPAQ